MTMRGPRLPVGSRAWIGEERESALRMVQSEVEEFSYSARNDFEWLNDHMAGIFDENEVNVADIFKTPGKLRGRTPMTTRRPNPPESRMPLSDVFSATPKTATATTNTFSKQLSRLQSPKTMIHRDSPSPSKHAPSPLKSSQCPPPQPTAALMERVAPLADSGYHGSLSEEWAVTAETRSQPQTESATPAEEAEADTGVETEVEDEPEVEADTESETGDKAGDYDTAEDGAEDGAGDEVEDQVEYGAEDGIEDGAEDGAEDEVEAIPSSAHESPVTPYQLESRPAPSPEATFQSAQEEPISNGSPDAAQTPAGLPPPGIPLHEPAVESVRPSPAQSPTRSPARASSPIPSPLAEASPQRPQSSEQDIRSTPPCPTPGRDPSDDEGGQRDEDSELPADTSSPIGPIARKSSLSFAPLPPREPLATVKSPDGPMARTSHLEQQQTSDYVRPTGGIGLGNPDARAEEGGAHDEMDVDEPDVPSSEPETDLAVNHNKTYTQRLQDRISLLGQTSGNTGRASKSVASLVRLSSAPASRAVKLDDPRGDTNAISLSPARKRTIPTTPGAFPSEGDDEDDEDFNENDFIDSPAVIRQPGPFSPRPILPKSYSADVVVDVAGHSATIGRDLSTSPMTPSQPPPVPEKDKTPAVQGKDGLVPVPLDLESRLANHRLPVSPIKGISVSNLPLADVLEDGDMPGTPTTPRSPTRTIRDSPLKQVRNKLTSILKSSKGLLASSAALSAEGKSSLLSPSRLDLRFPPSTESLVHPVSVTEPTYPDPGSQAGAAEPPQSPTRMASPGRPVRKTRASAEREREEKRKEKEAHRLAEQMDRLEKVREREREKARLFGGEKDRQKTERQQQQAGSPAREVSKPTSTSPTKAKHSDEADKDGSTNNDVGSKSAESRTDRHEENEEDGDNDDGNNEHDDDAAADDDDGDADDLIMEDAPAAAAPSSVTRPTNPPTHHPSRSREIKRPIKPTKDMAAKSRQAPTVIRVNTGSQHPQFRPSNSTLAANLHETFGPPANLQATPQINRTVGSQSTLKTKVSAQSLKSSVSSVGRPKALDIAAKRKEQEERETQRRREAKLEMERKRAAIQEEERRQDQERRQEAERAERQKQREREEAAEARRNAQRQAALEKAKQSRAPPPVARAHPTGPPEYGPGGGGGIINGQRDISRPPSRMNTDQQQHSRPVNVVLSSSTAAAAAAATKSAHKRPLQHDGGGGDGQSRGAKDAKRRRTGDDGSDGDGEAAEGLRNIKGPPVRPSGGLKKELPTKSAFPIRFSNQAQSRDVFKSLGQAKAAAHPLDMAQLSKAAIPFAANIKTPAAAAAKPTAPRPSPKFPNGDSIELPEIHTDDDDDEDDDEEEYGDDNGGGGGAGAGGAKRPSAIAPWADSPDLRRALMMQETIDPHQIFGPPAPLIMEEVFSKSKDRWHKFRARTSSANWSGADRLTEEEIRRDLQARDKLRRDGGWSYEMGKDMV